MARTKQNSNKDNNECVYESQDCKPIIDSQRNELKSQIIDIKNDLNLNINNGLQMNINIDVNSIQESTLGSEDKTRVVFIELNANQSKGRQPKSMENAFYSMKLHKFDPKWIQENQVLQMKSFDNYLFIIESFDGQVFNYLLEKKGRIVGPLAVLYCYGNECKTKFNSIPIKSYPIFSQCMRKLIISITGFEGQQKLDLINKIETMSGNFSKDLTKRVTHLVSDSVRTKKYKVASDLGITVVSSEWVYICWQKYQHSMCWASHESIVNKYRLPIFNKLIITVSQVDVNERNNIMKIVHSNGGDYSPALRLNATNTLLLLNTANGQKFRYAQMKGIPCLDVKWIYDSLNKGYALPEEQYIIESTDSQNCNTSLSIDSLNVGNNDPNNDPKSQSSQQKQSSSTAEIVNKSNVDSYDGTTDTSTQTIIQLIKSLKSDESDEHFLEGCVIYAIGFERSVIELMKSTVISCGALFLNELKPFLTHTIIGPNSNPSDYELLISDKNCKFVTIDWFYECLRQKECSDYCKYEFKNSKVLQNKSQEVFGIPLNSSQSRKALEKLKKDSEIHKSQNHKSLGDALNEEFAIEWCDLNVDGIPSQRPYNRCDSHENEMNVEKSENKPQINSQESKSDVEMTETDSTQNELMVTQSSSDNSSDNTSDNTSVPAVLRKFMFSGYDEQSKSDFTSLVNLLNGSVIESHQVSDSVTHLIIHDPTATEKTLSAIASGIWILKEDYLLESKRKGFFVSEEPFLWGFDLSNSSSDVLKKSVRKKLMRSAIEWRLHLNKDNIKTKLFDNWTVLMLNETKVTTSYRQVLKSGNANVDFVSPHIEKIDYSDYDYIFMDTNGVQNMSKSVIKCAKELIKCQKLVNIDFVSHYILNGPNCRLSTILSKLFVNNSIFANIESTNNRKRARDESEDNNPSKHKR